MSHDLPAICLLEPTSLLGRELLQVMEERRMQPRTVLGFHLGAGEEQQVAEILGEPALVGPLEEPEQVPEGSVLLIAGKPSEARRSVLQALLAGRPHQPVLDLVGTGLVEGPVLAGAPGEPLRPPRAVVASPGAAVIAGLVRPLLGLGVESVWAVAEVPASASGAGAVEALAGQAAARLQGLPPEEAPGAPVLAFDLVPGEPGRTAAHAQALLPGVEIAACEVRAGTFHGWIVHLGLRFAGPVPPGRLLELWTEAGTVSHDGDRFRLSGVVESEQIHVGPLAVSEPGRQVVVTAAADGLRVGGAATALEILDTLI